EAVESRAVELRRAADEVVDLRAERGAGAVVPGVRGDVAVVDEHRSDIPVLGFACEPVAPFEQQDPLAARRELPGQRSAACTRADDDHVVGVHAWPASFQYSARSSGTMIRAAASISARCEKACGKLPRCRPVSASNSSAYRPSGEAISRSFSIKS